MLDTREYFLEFPDQSCERYSANVIAENLYSQCDSEGRRFSVLKEIVDHRITSEALHGDDAYRTLKNGQKVPKRTTKGHQLLLRFRGNETEWMDPQTVKDSNPVVEGSSKGEFQRAAAVVARAKGDQQWRRQWSRWDRQLCTHKE